MASRHGWLIFFRRPVIIIFLLSALAKIIFGFVVVTDAERIISDPDSIGYYRLAENLRHHGIFSRCERPPFIPDNIITPVYPFFLAILLAMARGSLWIVPIAQGIINSLAAVLAFKMGERLFSRRAGFIAGICYALDTSALIHTFSILTESLFTFLFLLANFFLVKYIQQISFKNLALAALLFGLATLCRPVGLYYPVVVVIILLCTISATFPFRVKNVTLYVLLFTVTLSPWLIRNKLTFGVANLTSIQGNNLLLMNAAHLKAAQEGIPFAAAERRLEAEADSVLLAQGISTEKLKLEYHGKPYGHQINDPQQAWVYQKLAVDKIMASPLLYLRVHLTGLIASMLDASVRDIYHFRGQERPLLGLRSLFVTAEMGSALKQFWSKVDRGYLILYLSNLFWLAIHYVLILFTFYKLIKEKNFLSLSLLLAPIIYLLFITAPQGSERFRFPAMPYLYMLSGLPLSYWLRQASPSPSGRGLG
jgi:4-amino-4-deoxy-L-arabinose transferase-like glycosyltransferase